MVVTGIAGLVIAAIAGGFGRGSTQARIAPPPSDERVVSFNRDVRPILSNTCYLCHGPDSGTRKAGLRFDLREVATSELESGVRAIVPGDPDASAMIARITHADLDEVMPPTETGKSLSEEQIETLRLWIASGAEYQKHWSFEPPTAHPLPTVLDESWCENEIDRFILAQLEDEGLEPSDRASRETLFRRASLDLTGLPPSPDELNEFLADESTDAYPRAVDRLLASPRYGEHMARHWLDIARYGDTHGLHLDNARQMWPWRDWVIKAFNDNMPFDRFSVEQLAGDLLPDPTQDQIIATGFNRNHVSTNEGGVIPEEFQIKNVADRLATTSTVWMGLTMACAHCHKHKFDPISHAEYYEMFAFFNNTTENPMDGNRADWAPIARAPSPEQAGRLAVMGVRAEAMTQELDAPSTETDAKQEVWRYTSATTWNTGWRVLDVESAASTWGATLTTLEDGSVLASGDNPDQDVYEFVYRTDQTDLRLLRLEALAHESLPYAGAGRADNGNFVLSEIEVEASSIADPTVRVPVRLVAASADHQQMNGPYPIGATIDGIIAESNGWAVDGMTRREDRLAVFVADQPFGFAGGTELRVRLRFETQHAQHTIGRVRLAASGDETLYHAVAPVGFGVWHAAGPFASDDRATAYETAFGPESEPGAFDAGATFAEDLTWTTHPEWADGVVQTLEGKISATYLSRSVFAPTARKLAISLGSDDAIKVWLNGRIVHENNVARAVAPDQDRIEIDLLPGENRLLMKIVNFGGGYGFYFDPADDAGGSEYLQIVPLITAEAPSDDDLVTLRRYFRRNHSPRMRELYEQLADLAAERQEFEASLPFSLVMQEREERRPTYRLHRGEYDQPREELLPDVPDALPPMGDDTPRNRLGLAEWLVDDGNPLTARVTVNRLWQQLFGTGIVKSAGDFGSQGEWPSHPELLDTLAVGFRDSGWDVKGVLRLMVTSATYMQDSAVSPELLARDPGNRLLARGPRFRLEAEEIRDQALYAGGLLIEQLGGPGVKPYEPPGLWKAVAYPDSNTATFMVDSGEAQHRRSMYTYWKRTSHPANLAAFDAPNREGCTVVRSRTNTPMQVLVLLNDPQFVEAARGLAQRVLTAEADPDAQLSLAFRLLTSRTPHTAELAVLRELFDAERARFAASPEDAAALLSVGESPRDDTLDAADHAAMTNVATTIMTLDEVITKG
jgi:hypothetical protein